MPEHPPNIHTVTVLATSNTRCPSKEDKAASNTSALSCDNLKQNQNNRVLQYMVKSLIDHIAKLEKEKEILADAVNTLTGENSILKKETNAHEYELESVERKSKSDDSEKSKL